MTYKWFEDWNPFSFFMISSGGVLLLRSYFINKPGKVRPYVLMLSPRILLSLMIICAISVLGFLSFEYYFYGLKCRVSQRYYDGNIKLANEVIDVMEEYKIPYWPDFATLLNVMRGEEINPWDHDVDFGIIEPDHIEGFLKRFQDRGYIVEFSSTRGLMQLRRPGRKGPHADIWTWIPVTNEETGETILELPDIAVRSRLRPSEIVFPLAPAVWMGRNVTIPRDPHAVAKLEFAQFGGDYMVAEVFRGDCYHNYFNARWMY